MGDPTRRAMVERLCQGPQTTSGLANPLKVTLTAVTQHLRVLEKCGLVRTEKVGRVRTCRIEKSGFNCLQQWIDHYRSMWESRLDRLGELLEGPEDDG